MFIINRIRYKLKSKTEACIYHLLIFSKNLLASNQSVFENFNVIQIGINK